MTFSYNSYLRAGLYVPAASLLFVLCIAVYRIVMHIKKRERGTWAIAKGIGIPLIAIILFLSGTIPTLKYTVYLVNEKPEDSIQFTGNVEAIREAVSSPRYHVSDEDSNIVRASIVKLDGNDYYFMTAKGLNIGDSIIVTYLPKSRIALSWNRAFSTVDND